MAAALGDVAGGDHQVVCNRNIVIVKYIPDPSIRSQCGGKETLWSMYVNEPSLREEMVDYFGTARVLKFKGDLESVGELTAGTGGRSCLDLLC